jgi:hypothetical protein
LSRRSEHRLAIGPELWGETRRLVEFGRVAARALRRLPQVSRKSAHQYPRLCFAALGRGAIGWSPFGLDYTSYSTEPQGAPRMADEALAPIALNYKMLEPMMREVARLNFEGTLQAIAEEPGQARQTMAFGSWTAVITFGANPDDRLMRHRFGVD